MFGGKQGHATCVWVQSRACYQCLGARKGMLPVSGGRQRHVTCVWGQAKACYLCLGAKKGMLPVKIFLLDTSFPMAVKCYDVNGAGTELG